MELCNLRDGTAPVVRCPDKCALSLGLDSTVVFFFARERARVKPCEDL
jgi:hypothetical protein